MTSYVCNVFLTVLLSLSLRASGPLTWKSRVQGFVFATLLHLWRFGKMVYRGLRTGRGALARLCEALSVTEGLRVRNDQVRFDNMKVRMLVWRIGRHPLRMQLMRHGISLVD